MDDRRFQIKIDGPAVEKGQISFSMLSRLLKGIQETVYSIALAGIQYDYRQRIRVPGEVKRACELYRVAEETGSYSLTAEIAQAQSMSGIEDIGLYAKNKYLEVLTILKDDQNWNHLNDLIPDSSYRRKILRSISSYCPKAGEGWCMSVGQAGKSFSTLNQGIPESIHKFLVHPIKQDMVVSGELVQLHLDENKLGLYYAPAKKVIHCSYDPELEDYVIASLKEIIQVYGQVQLDNRGIPEKIVDVFEIEGLDLSPLIISDIQSVKNLLRLKEELIIPVDFDLENQEYVLDYPELNISLGTQSREELLAEFCADFLWVWLEYGKGNEDQMSEDAKQLKRRVVSMVHKKESR